MKCCEGCTTKYRSGPLSCEDTCKILRDEKKRLEKERQENEKRLERERRVKEALFERSQKLYKEKVNRKNTLELAKQHLIDDLTLDVVQKRALGIPTRRVYE